MGIGPLVTLQLHFAHRHRAVENRIYFFEAGSYCDSHSHIARRTQLREKDWKTIQGPSQDRFNEPPNPLGPYGCVLE